MANKSLYAYLVAIDDYQAVRKLNGCVNDMHAFRDYLVRQCKNDEYELKLLTLENQNATRNLVINGFQHFKEAKKGDMCVLYFSGHGSRIPTQDFWEAFDGRNESILCVDSRMNGKSDDIADKELSCLIYEAMKGKEGVHFLAVMDCCHSGGNTRGDGAGIAGERMENPAKTARPIQEYYGFDKNLYIKDANGLYSAPKGDHIQFGACRSYETAKEVWVGTDVRGAFTYSLLEALESTSSLLSYTDMERRVGQKIENRTANQRPQLDAVGNADKNNAFMGAALASKNRYFVAWNNEKRGWELNAGAFHGITAGATPSLIQLTAGGAKFLPTEVFTDTTVVTWQDATVMPDKTKQYDVSVQKGGSPARPVAFAECELEAKKSLTDNLATANVTYIQVIPDLQQSSYQVHAKDGKIWLTQSGSDKPVFLPVTGGYGLPQVLEFWSKTDSVLQWMHLKNLESNSENLGDKDFTLQLYRGERVKMWHTVTPDQMTPIADWREPGPFSYLPDAQGNSVPSSFALRIVNTSQVPLFVSALYMDGRFGITNRYLPSERIMPQEETWLTLRSGTISTKSIGLGIEESHFQAGMTEIMDYIKIIVATDKACDTSGFEQDSLQILGLAESKRSALELPTIEKPAWTTRLIPIQIIRPQSAAALQAGQETSLSGKLKIKTPLGFTAKASLANEAGSARSADDMPSPIGILGVEPFEMTQGFQRSAGLSVLVLDEIEGIENVSLENPMEIELENPKILGPDEVIMPFVFDKSTQGWYPAGFPGDAENSIKITNLLEEDNADASTPGDRNVKKALRLFFYKITKGGAKVGSVVTKETDDQTLFSLSSVKIGEDLEQDPIVETDLAVIEKAVEKAQRILIFTHGFIGETKHNIKFVRRLMREKQVLCDCYDLILTFDYESLSTTPELIAERLAEKLALVGIDPIKAKGKTIHAIGHSMGGMVMRWWIEQLGGKSVVTHFIQVCSPNNGAKITKVHDWAMFALTKAVNFVPIPGLVKDIAGWLARASKLDTIDDNILQMKPDSPFMLKMKNSPDPGIPYTIICGDTEKMPKGTRDKQEPVFKHLLKRLGYGIKEHLIFKEPNDWVVGLSSAQEIPARADIKLLDPLGCDHFSPFRDPNGLKTLGEVMWGLNEVV